MPIQFLYTDKEIVNIQRSLLFKNTLTSEELTLLNEINNYMKSI